MTKLTEPQNKVSLMKTAHDTGMTMEKNKQNATVIFIQKPYFLILKG